MKNENFPVLYPPDDYLEIEDVIERRFALQEEFLGTDKPVNHIDPMVSIMVITYQQGDHIQQCLDSLLIQKAGCPFEIVIGEDQSTDGTREICIEFAKKYPDRIRLFPRDRNLSLFENNGRVRYFNSILTHRACRGKYIAQCEGDDYWINPRKLQMQVDLLERDPNIGLVHGEAHFYYENTGQWVHNIHRRRQDLDSRDGLLQALIEARYRVITCTAMYRKALYDQISTHLSYRRQRICAIGDVPTWIELSRLGSFGYIDEPLGVYRLRKESASRSNSPEKNLAFGLEMLFWRVRYMEHYGVPEEFFQLIVKQYAKPLLARASCLGEPDVARELLELLIKAGVRFDQFDRIYRLCAKLAGGPFFASLARRIELHINQKKSN